MAMDPKIILPILFVIIVAVIVIYAVVYFTVEGPKEITKAPDSGQDPGQDPVITEEPINLGPVPTELNVGQDPLTKLNQNVNTLIPSSDAKITKVYKNGTINIIGSYTGAASIPLYNDNGHKSNIEMPSGPYNFHIIYDTNGTVLQMKKYNFELNDICSNNETYLAGTYGPNTLLSDIELPGAGSILIKLDNNFDPEYYAIVSSKSKSLKLTTDTKGIYWAFQIYNTSIYPISKLSPVNNSALSSDQIKYVAGLGPSGEDFGPSTIIINYVQNEPKKWTRVNNIVVDMNCDFNDNLNVISNGILSNLYNFTTTETLGSLYPRLFGSDFCFIKYNKDGLLNAWNTIEKISGNDTYIAESLCTDIYNNLYITMYVNAVGIEIYSYIYESRPVNVAYSKDEQMNGTYIVKFTDKGVFSMIKKIGTLRGSSCVATNKILVLSNEATSKKLQLFNSNFNVIIENSLNASDVKIDLNKENNFIYVAGSGPAGSKMTDFAKSNIEPIFRYFLANGTFFNIYSANGYLENIPILTTFAPQADKIFNTLFNVNEYQQNKAIVKNYRGTPEECKEFCGTGCSYFTHDNGQCTFYGNQEWSMPEQNVNIYTKNISVDPELKNITTGILNDVDSLNDSLYLLMTYNSFDSVPVYNLDGSVAFMLPVTNSEFSDTSGFIAIIKWSTSASLYAISNSGFGLGLSLCSNSIGSIYHSFTYTGSMTFESVVLPGNSTGSNMVLMKDKSLIYVIVGADSGRMYKNISVNGSNLALSGIFKNDAQILNSSLSNIGTLKSGGPFNNFVIKNINGANSLNVFSSSGPTEMIQVLMTTDKIYVLGSYTNTSPTFTNFARNFSPNTDVVVVPNNDTSYLFTYNHEGTLQSTKFFSEIGMMMSSYLNKVYLCYFTTLKSTVYDIQTDTIYKSINNVVMPIIAFDEIGSMYLCYKDPSNSIKITKYLSDGREWYTKVLSELNGFRIQTIKDKVYIFGQNNSTVSYYEMYSSGSDVGQETLEQSFQKIGQSLRSFFKI